MHPDAGTGTEDFSVAREENQTASRSTCLAWVNACIESVHANDCGDCPSFFHQAAWGVEVNYCDVCAVAHVSD